jgi:hypothetical protein
LPWTTNQDNECVTIKSCNSMRQFVASGTSHLSKILLLGGCCIIAAALSLYWLGDTIPEAHSVPAARRSAVKCIYHLLKMQPGVQSVTVYIVDGFRSAVGFSFRAADGRIVSSDIMISGQLVGQLTYSTVVRANDSDALVGEQINFESGISRSLQKACLVTPAFDNMFPRPPGRQQWRPVDWSN